MRVGVPTLVLLAMSALATPSFGQLSITSFQPSEISYIGQTPYTLTGSGFTPGVTSGMVVRIDGVATTLTSVTSTQITGFAPSHAVTIDPVDVTVQNAAGASVTLPDVVSYIGPLSVDSVAPTAIPAFTGGATVTVTGVAFIPTASASLLLPGGTPMPVSTTFVDARHLTFPAPSLAPGAYDVRVSIPAGAAVLTITLAGGLTVVPPLDLQTFQPTEVSIYGATPFAATGTGFTQSTILQIAGIPVTPTFVSAGLLTGTVPPNPGVPLGAPVPVIAIDPVAGSDTLPRAFQYVGPFDLASIDPPVWPLGSSTAIDLFGTAFTASTQVEIGGIAATVQFVAHDQLRALPSSSLSTGLYDVRAFEGTSSSPIAEDTLLAALTISDSSGPVLADVEPHLACATGGTFVVISGSHFIPETQVWIGPQPLLDRVVDIHGGTITGIIPCLLPSQTPGPVLVTVTDFRGSWESSDLLAYTESCATLRSVEQLESSLAYGTALFSWHNPEPYTEIHVLDLDGNLMDILPAGTTSYEVGAGAGESSVTLQFQGVTDADISSAVPESAQAFPCSHAPPIGGAVVPGVLDLSIRGGHLQEKVIVQRRR
ncbi:MAG: IPT/TIG domain-containing protein [Planctomycetes bacterium]|nr:IPT/TIG domain-containing protein [Planctomycetota bacterium]